MDVLMSSPTCRHRNCVVVRRLLQGRSALRGGLPSLNVIGMPRVVGERSGRPGVPMARIVEIPTTGGRRQQVPPARHVGPRQR